MTEFRSRGSLGQEVEMNIFVLDRDPVVAASYLCNAHTVKMILESAQLLCTTSWQFNVPAPYKQTHKNHPAAI